MRGLQIILAMIAGFVVPIATSGTPVFAQAAPGGAAPSIADNDAAILVLHDGGVLTGQITRAADWYVVSRGGGQLQVAQSRVMLVCRTMEEAYEFRRQQIAGTKVEPHLSLADWCLRYDLFDEARRELASARRLDPDHLRLALLERRLEKASAQPTVTGRGATAANAQTQTAPSTPQIATTAHALPAGAVELFTRRVQPVLVNNCTTSGCHQPGGPQSFQLDRAILRGEANRRSTMQNLTATLALIDREHPDESLLLTIPRKRHGRMSGPILGPRKEQAFNHLVDWVALVATPPPPMDEAESADGEDAVSPQPPNVGEGIAPSLPTGPVNQAEAAPTRRPGRQPQAPMIGEDDEAPSTLKPPHRLRYGVQLEPWRPRDAFDPEIFNRLERSPIQNRGVAEPAIAVEQR